MSNLIGKSLGRYHILEQIGEGGMAIVYKAFDTRLEREVAVKVIRMGRLAPDIADKALKRFEREGKALARLNHPNIISIIDYGDDKGHPYLVMPFLPGGTLKEKLRADGKTNWQDAARLLLPVAKALAYAHEEEMIHRDVKPANILITRSGDPMLTDFGIAKILDEESTMDLTGTRATVGTPEYMAPEQVIAKTVDHRADIYALGVVFYEMVTGRKPFQADTPMAVLVKLSSEPLPRPTEFTPKLPKAVEQVLLKALAKDRNNRYKSMKGFAAVLGKLAVGPIRQKNVARKQKSKKTSNESAKPVQAKILRNMAAVFGMLAIVVIAGVFISTKEVLALPFLPQAERNEAAASGVPSHSVSGTLPVVSTGIAATMTKKVSVTSTPIPSGTILLEEDFEDGVADNFQIVTGQWNVIDDSNSKVLESKDSNSTNWAHVEFGPEKLSNFVIEYEVKFKDFDLSENYASNAFLQFWAENWGDSNYSLNIQPEWNTFTLGYSGQYPDGEWVNLGEIPLKVEKDVWYLIRLELVDNEMTVYLPKFRPN
jgi:serine/threonine protein kinase